MQEDTHSIQQIFRIIAPHESVVDSRDIRRVKILAGFSLFLTVVFFFPIVTVFLMTGAFHSASWIYAPIFFLAYVFSRTQWPNIGASFLVFGQAILTLYLLLTARTPDAVPVLMIFTLFPILLSTLVSKARATIILGILTILSLPLILLTVSEVSFGAFFPPFAAIIFLAGLAGTASLIREQDIETIEKQSLDLGDYSKDLEKDVARITAMSEVGQAITRTQDLDTLLEQVVNLIIERFDFYHAQIFLIDEKDEYAVLEESTGAAGAELKARGHRLAIGSQSIIGRVTANGEPVIALETDSGSMYQRNELLPHTRSEIVLPLRVSGKVTGVLDIHSINAKAFSPKDVPVLQTMADQLAIAIENAKLFSQAQRDLLDIERRNRQLTGEAWNSFMQGRSSGQSLGFQMKGGKLSPLTREQIEKTETTENTLSLPLSVRGETIGMLDVTPRDTVTPNDETQAMLEAVAERVSLALDSARLGEQAQKHASREQILSAISVKLQGSNDLNAILRIVVSEASRALGVSRGFIHLTMDSGSQQIETNDQ